MDEVTSAVSTDVLRICNVEASAAATTRSVFRNICYNKLKVPLNVRFEWLSGNTYR
jgi:hypothetical protein